jgi:hypothetical protein
LKSFAFHDFSWINPQTDDIKKGRRDPALLGLGYVRLSTRRFEQPGDVLMKVDPEPHQHEDGAGKQIEPCDRPTGQNAIDTIK